MNALLHGAPPAHGGQPLYRSPVRAPALVSRPAGRRGGGHDAGVPRERRDLSPDDPCGTCECGTLEQVLGSGVLFVSSSQTANQLDHSGLIGKPL